MVIHYLLINFDVQTIIVVHIVIITLKLLLVFAFKTYMGSFGRAIKYSKYAQLIVLFCGKDIASKILSVQCTVC